MNIKQLTDTIQPQLIRAIQRLVAIESVQSEASEQAPFGENVKKALDEVLMIAQELGFETVNLDNKIGYALLKGTGQSGQYFGIFGHIDVVPIGKDWQYDPMGSQIANNRLYGRGVLDNKGPILANLFALYVLKEAGVRFKQDIRIVFGCNEETGFECVKHYVACQKPAIFGWTPDCKWPTVYGECGRLKLAFNSEITDNMYRFLEHYILPDSKNGKALSIDYSDDDFGALIMRNYALQAPVNGYTTLTCDISYPANCTKDKLMDKIMVAAKKYQLTVDVLKNWNPILYDKNSDYVKLLQQVYNECTQMDATPVTTTGGTYAKIVPNIIAYGPSFPDQKNIAHLPDEWIDLTDLAKMTEIYATALYRLKEKG